jgi:hypothetical protein
MPDTMTLLLESTIVETFHVMRPGDVAGVRTEAKFVVDGGWEVPTFAGDCRMAYVFVEQHNDEAPFLRAVGTRIVAGTSGSHRESAGFTLRLKAGTEGAIWTAVFAADWAAPPEWRSGVLL